MVRQVLMILMLRLYSDSNSDGVADGPILSSTSTNGAGIYTFTDVEPGNYIVVQISPLYYSSIMDHDESINANDADGDDSGEGPDNNIPVVMLPGETDADNNFEEGRPGVICGYVTDTLDQPMSNVIIQLYHDLDNDDAFSAGDT